MTAITLVELPPFDELHPVDQPADALRLGETFSLYPTPTLFELHRIIDVTGVSGQGRIAVGIIWPLIGGAVMRWSTPRPPAGYPLRVRQLEVVDSIAEIMGVHGHCGSTRLRLLDPCNPPAGSFDQDTPEAFAIVDPSNDVTAWGVWFPRDDRAVTYRPDRSMLAGVEQEHRVAAYRGLTSLARDLPAPTDRDGQHRLVYLNTGPGRQLITRVNAAHVDQLKRARLAMDLATRGLTDAADLRAQLGMPEPS